MKESSAYLTPLEAAELLGCSSRTITNNINRGKLSAIRDDGRFYIDKAEFFRVFPQAFIKEQERNPAYKVQEDERMRMEHGMLKELLSQKEKEIAFLRGQLEAFSNEKSKMLDAITHHARLLEYKESKPSTTKDGWFKIFRK